MTKKVDANHAEIVQALRRLGCSVADTHTLGRGYPDMLAGIGGRHNLMIEVKCGPRWKLTPDEEQFHRTWKGSPIRIVTSVEDAIALVREVWGNADSDGTG